MKNLASSCKEVGFAEQLPASFGFEDTTVPKNSRIRKKIASHMIKLRLKRYGKKRAASYRIVAMNSATRRDGRPLEELGFYDPRTDETRLEVPAIVKRLKEGAQPTETVRRILEKANVFEQVKS